MKCFGQVFALSLSLLLWFVLCLDSVPKPKPNLNFRLNKNASKIILEIPVFPKEPNNHNALISVKHNSIQTLNIGEPVQTVRERNHMSFQYKFYKTKYHSGKGAVIYNTVCWFIG